MNPGQFGGDQNDCFTHQQLLPHKISLIIQRMCVCEERRRFAPKPQTKITIKYLHTLITCNTRAEHLSRELLPHFANPFQIHAPSNSRCIFGMPYAQSARSNCVCNFSYNYNNATLHTLFSLPPSPLPTTTSAAMAFISE